MENFYTFKDQELLKEALTHSSFSNERGDCMNNERLELLGDSVLGLAITDILLDIYPQDDEGEISMKRDKLVNETTLFDIAKKLKIEEKIYFGKGEEKSGGRNKKRLVASAFEAVIGAVYMDSNFKTVKDVIHSMFKENLLSVRSEMSKINYKDKLQQIVYKKSLGDPEYRIGKTEGPDHNKKFFVDVFVDDEHIATGVGGSKKFAEQSAAKLAVEKMRIDE